MAATAPHPSLVPAPRSLQLVTGPPLRIDARTTVDAGPGTEGTARWLRATVGAATGLSLPPAPPAGSAGQVTGVLRLRVSEELGARLGPEGYRLTVRDHGAELVGGGPAGVFWGAQTLRQLLGPESFRRAPLGPADRDWTVPALDVEDAPRFGWRGFMLDVARHFFPKDTVLRYLDLLAAHKLNVLHLHLTDDQGWRLEVRRYPRLTEVGAWRRRTRVGHTLSPYWDERPHGGFYTQDDIREIVAYAAERHITVVPEIDLPGHSQAAIAAYPELGNRDVVDTAGLEVWPDWGINPNVLAPTEEVCRFYEGVLEEVLELFPAPFVHIGGDECVKDQWRASETAQRRLRELGLRDEQELQNHLIRHFDRWLADRGRRLLGWDEILQGGGRAAHVREEEGAGGPLTRFGLADSAVVFSWRGFAGGVAAARAGHDVVMCPKQFVYLDYRQAAGEAEPVPIAQVRTLRDVYGFEPVPPELAGTEAARHVLGAQANLWTEVVEDQQRADYQAFPRLAAFAEVVWSPLPAPEERDWDGFETRMTEHYARLDALGVAYRPPSGPHPWQQRPGIPGRPIDGPPTIG